MPEKYRRYYLKSREAKSILSEAAQKLKVDLERLLEGAVNVELVETEYASLFLINGKPFLVKVNERIFPTLVFGEFFRRAPKVVVDMGAVPHVCKGADVMAPGIVRFEGEFSEGDLVFVVDEKFGKPIAVGEILYDAARAEGVEHGVVVKILHFVGDRVWNLVKEFAAKAR